jgi:regulator of protease activity HflC (stomatin/prohibitin superfamily)
MKISSRRAEHTALLAVALTVVFFVLIWVLSGLSSSFALASLKWQFLGTSIISIILWFQFRLRGLAEQEKLDLAQLDKAGEQNIFAEQGGQVSMFAVAAKRLELFEKWFLPVLSGLTSAYQVGIGIYLLKNAAIMTQFSVKSAQIAAIFMFLIAFASFLIARYATGLSVQIEWKPIRALGSWLLACAVFSFLIAVSLGLAQLKYSLMHIVLGWAVPCFMIVLGGEVVLNLIFDIYRPRITGQYHRASVDSRLLGIFNEPGGVFHSIATTIDYQFGFKVSQTWFYKLLEKAIMPLAILSIILLWLMSCILVVGPGEQAVIERFGTPLNKAEVIESGFRFKYPWPIDIAYVEKVDQIRFLPIGYTPKADPMDRTPLIWGRPHHEKEENLLVGSEVFGTFTEQGASSFGMVVTAVPVRYRIKNLYDYLYMNSTPIETLAAIAQGELTRFAVSAKVETSDDEKLSGESLLGGGRAKASELLRQRIQQRIDEKQLGIEIVFVALEGVHPPKEVAADYQAVIGAGQQRQATILAAMAQRNKVLASLGGSVDKVYNMYNLSEQYLEANRSGNQEKIAKVGGELDEQIKQASGEIYYKLSLARSYAFEKANRAKADGLRFSSQMKAYKAAPQIYARELRLAMLEEALQNTRKYVVISDVNDHQILIFDLKEKIEQSLYDIEIPEKGK